MTSFKYAGEELDLFAEARRWKQYWSSFVARFVSGDVVEVGAGLGVNSALIRARARAIRSWVCLEPDENLFAGLAQRMKSHGATNHYSIRLGTLSDLPEGEIADAILYIDVLEHIPCDKEELDLAGRRLRPGGTIVVLAPAHQKLFSSFDKPVGHCRRYSKASVAALKPQGLLLELNLYLDSVGLLASYGNRLLLKQSLPTLRQIRLWDRIMVPLSVRLDRLVGYSLGKSILAVWRKPTPRDLRTTGPSRQYLLVPNCQSEMPRGRPDCT